MGGREGGQVFSEVLVSMCVASTGIVSDHGCLQRLPTAAAAGRAVEQRSMLRAPVTTHT